MFRYAEITPNGKIHRVYNRNHPFDLSTVKRINGKLTTRPVEVFGPEDDYDKEIYHRVGPTYEIEDEVVREVFELKPRDNYETILHQRLDEKCQVRRANYLTDYTVGGAVTVIFQMDEARKFLADDAPNMDMYPFLRSGIGIYAPDAEGVAKYYLMNGNRVRMALALLERVRVVTHGAIETAETAEEKLQILENVKWDTSSVGDATAVLLD